MDQNSSKTILVVEDDSVMLSIVVKEAKLMGYNVLEAEDGEKAIEIALAQKPGLIVLDLLLPKIDGFKVLETIRKNSDPAVANVPVVVLSNLWSNKDILRTEALKIEAYFVKANTTMQQVMEKVNEILKKV